MASADRISKIMRLINDPLFAEFEELQNEYSFFNIVGRTYTETWHSALLGWLLNPSSNHNLDDYALRRFVMLMVEKEQQKASRKYPLNDLLIDADFTEAKARPNEMDPQEVSIKSLETEDNKGGRIDVFIDGIRLRKTKVSVLVEMKVNARISQQQCKKYVEFINIQQRRHGIVMYPVFVTPDWNLGADNETLFGSNQWIVLEFQDIYDEIIIPCLANGKLSEFGRFTLQEYVKVLKYPNDRKGNRRMVVTEKERELAYKLQEKYGDVISALIEILRPEEDMSIPVSSGNNAGRKKPPIKIEIDKKIFEQPSIPALYGQVLKYLVENKLLDSLELPVSTGHGRYLLAKEPVHPKGHSFLVPVQEGEFYMEAHKSREGGIRDLLGLLDKLGITHKNLTKDKGD